MKTICRFLLLSLEILWGAAATTKGDQVTTNYVEAHPDFRRVDGKLYNRATSQLWRQVSGSFICTNQGGIILQTWNTTPIYEAKRDTRTKFDRLKRIGLGSGGYVPDADRTLVGYEKSPGLKVFIKNYPLKPRPITASEISCRALPIGSVEFRGETISAYDFGMPNMVPVVTTNTTTSNPPRVKGSFFIDK